MPATCTARVWDNGDMTDCGKPVMIANRCLDCRNWELKGLREKVRKLQGELVELEARIEVLASEDAQDHVMLATGRI